MPCRLPRTAALVLPPLLAAAGLLPAAVAAAEAAEAAQPEEACLLQVQAGARQRGARREEPGGGEAAAEGEAGEPLRILFVGNSFTYGPAPFGSDKQNNLPRLFKLVAESLGQPVFQQEDTIGGCSLHHHRPSSNPSGLDCSLPEADCVFVNSTWVELSDGCTVGTGTLWWSDNAPCPQALLRQDDGAWDVVVLQDHSQLPTVRKALDTYYLPAVKEFSQVLQRSGRRQRRRFGQPVIAAYDTWAYYDGIGGSCPGSGGNPACYPLGLLPDLLPGCKEDANNTWRQTVETAPCQSYTLARATSEALSHGATVMVPAGLAWDAARGFDSVPQACRETADAEFGGGSGKLSGLDLPLRTEPSNAIFKGAKAHELYRDMGPDYVSHFCDDGCHHDHHPSALGAYLNALVFYATLLKKSPVGAAFPQGQVVDGLTLPTIDEAQAQALQRVVQDAVLPHLDVWWSGAPAPLTDAAEGLPREAARGATLPGKGGLQLRKPSEPEDI